ncbi:archaeosortase/exosortase family protein [Seonamhaeicola sp. ML3]|uniref:archaeosortase/exosortase family protein n=1 Tax=Seonamhaeicola sp. ML3 TaxID=2937786 RepID=UPI00200ED6A0|nr:archaeosortase/exosortase family protein [Seonamhaeicola sp. ML3]
MINNLKSVIAKVPKNIKLFLGKAFILFIAWKLIYSLFLYNSKYLDHPLTTHVGEASVFLINQLGDLEGYTTKRVTDVYNINGNVVNEESSAIYHNDRMVLHIANACNGLELMVLYIGFIICMPSSFLRKLLYIVVGILILDMINILRCTGLIYLREYYHVYFQFAHRYLFNAVTYTATFILWVVFSRKISFKNENI